MANKRSTEREAYLEKLRKEREAKELSDKKSTRRFEIAMIAIVVVLIAGFTIGALSYNAYLDSGAKSRSLTVASTENFSVDGAMMSYYIYSQYWQIINYYGDYVSYIGLDTSKSLRAQDQADGVTWFDYLAGQAKSSVEEMLVLNEAARAAGYTLSDADKEIADYRAGFTEEQYLPNFGRGLKHSDVANIMQLKLMATRAAYDEMDKADVSDSAINAYYAATPEAYQTVDYLKYEFDYSADNTYNLSADTAAAYAAELAATSDADSFKAWVKAFATDNNTDETVTEDSINTAVEGMLTSDAAYSSSDDMLVWAFGGATVGETNTAADEANSLITVTMLITEPRRDESETRNMRHILISTAQQDDPEAFATQLMNEIVAAGGTEEVFAEYAIKYSEDEGSCYDGGLYENVAAGQFVSAVETWVFDSARTKGEIAVVESDYGFHVMYYIGEGLQAWAGAVAEDIINEYYSGVYEGWTALYPVTYNEATVDKIPEAQFNYGTSN